MEKLRRYIIFALLYIASTHLYAQTTLTGIVRSQNNNQPLSGVMVSLKQDGSKRVIKFTTTQSDGSYKLEINTQLKGYMLQFSLMGHATLTTLLTEGKTKYDVTMTEKIIELKEVTVKAPSIRQRGDTLTYSIASFADANDKSLADVLKKMPGIEVTESGQIKHNGKALNKFYIEGHDMLGGRYNLATMNIHQADVASVEVMQNHQPIKALEDMSFSENPAINIRLKEAAKSRLVGTMKIGGGFEPNIWEGEATLMRFTKKTQSLNTLKSNNIGTDVTRESDMLIDDIGSSFLNRHYSLKNHIHVRPDRLTEIGENRVRQNQTHSLTMNNLWALGKSTDLSTQLLYSHDRLVSSSRSLISYFLNDSTIVTEDNQQAKSKQNKLSTSIMLNRNTNKLYLSNTLSADMQWNDIDIHTTGTYPNIQNAELPLYKIQDKFEILKRTGKRAFTFNSYNGFMLNPQTLFVTRDTEKQYQTVRSDAFYSNSNTSLGFYLNPFTVSMKVGMIIISRRMKSHLEGVPDSLGIMENHLNMSYLCAYASPEAEFSNKGWNIRFRMPVNYTPYFFRDKLLQTKKNYHKVRVEPSLYVKYRFSPRFEMSLSGSISQAEINEQDFYNGLILSDYRNLYTGFVNYDSENGQSLSLNIDYKRPLNTFFANAYLSRNWNESALTTVRQFVDNYILNSYLARRTHSSGYITGGRISKGLNFMQGMVSLSTNYMSLNGSLVQNNGLSNYQSDLLNTTAKINAHPVNWLAIIYELTFGKELMKLKEIDITSASTSVSQRLTCNLNISKSWVFKLLGEHYSNQISENRHKQLFIADISTAYSFKSGVELSLNIRNLFNQKTYAYTAYSGLTQIHQQYELRPRNIWASVFFHF